MKAVILDFDGTVADTNVCICATFRATLEQLQLPDVPDDDIRRMIGLPLWDMFRQLCHLSDETLVNRCVEVYRSLFNDIANRTTRLFPYVDTTIITLKQLGYGVTIASSRGHDSLLMFLRKFGLTEYVDIVVGVEDVAHAKPAPDMIHLILDRLGITAAETLMVGDTTYDIEMGQRAGCPTCGVTYGNHSREQLSRQGATHIIDNFADLLPLMAAPRLQ